MKSINLIRLVFLVALILNKHSVQSQKLMSLSFFNHATTLPPYGFGRKLHPGFDVGYTVSQDLRKNKISFIHWKAGYYYHRLVHHGIQFYGEYIRMYLLRDRWKLGWSGGLGYLHTIALQEKFKLQNNGLYTRTDKLGSAHAQASLAMKFLYSSLHVAPFVEYRFRMVTPFVNKYVALLPSTSVHVGIYFIINPSQK